jgi:hypothetical protein
LYSHPSALPFIGGCAILGLGVLSLLLGNYARRARRRLHNLKRLHALEQNTDIDSNADDLIKYIFAPDYDSFDKLTDIEKTRNICAKAMLLFPIGLSSHNDLPFHRVLLEVMRGKRGLLCGGHAFLLAKIYNIFKFPAITVNYGFVDTRDTHVMTAVKVRINEREMVILQDCMLGLEFMNMEKGEPMDLMVLTSKLHARLDHEVGLSPVYIQGLKPHLMEEIEDWFFWRRGEDKPAINEIEWLRNKYSEMEMSNKTHYLDFPADQRLIIEYLESHLAKRGANIFSMLLNPIGIGGENAILHDYLRDFYRRELNVNL